MAAVYAGAAVGRDSRPRRGWPPDAASVPFASPRVMTMPMPKVVWSSESTERAQRLPLP